MLTQPRVQMSIKHSISIKYAAIGSIGCSLQVVSTHAYLVPSLPLLFGLAKTIATLAQTITLIKLFTFSPSLSDRKFSWLVASVRAGAR